MRANNLLVLVGVLPLLVACGDDGAADQGQGVGDDAGQTVADGTTAGDATSSSDTNVGPATCKAPANRPCDGVAEVPPPLNEHGAAYFDSIAEMVVFGGNTAVPDMCSFRVPWVFSDTTWIYYNYENECGQWTKVPGVGPSARGRHAYTQSDTGMFIFGGRFRADGLIEGPYDLFDDVWRFDSTTRTWTQLETTGDAPTARANSAMVHDKAGNRLWVFAGNTSPSGAIVTATNDLYYLDLSTNTWTNIVVEGNKPAPRLWHTLTFDAKRNQLVVYGGGDDTAFFDWAKYMREVWAFDIASGTWKMLHDGGAGAPEGRFWSTFNYVAADDKYLLIGGHDDALLGNRNDTWIFDPSDNSWGLVREGDTWNKPANGTCDFPTDFTNVDLQAPERRNAHTFVWSKACGTGLMFGGKTDCGAINDVWRFGGGKWGKLYGSGSGEVCLRTQAGDISKCTSMCQ